MWNFRNMPLVKKFIRNLTGWQPRVRPEKWLIPFVAILFVFLVGWRGFLPHVPIEETRALLDKLQKFRSNDISAIHFRNESGTKDCFSVTASGEIGSVLLALRNAEPSSKPGHVSYILRFSVEFRVVDTKQTAFLFRGGTYKEYPGHVFLYFSETKERHVIEFSDWAPWILRKYRQSHCRGLIRKLS